MEKRKDKRIRSEDSDESVCVVEDKGGKTRKEDEDVVSRGSSSFVGRGRGKKYDGGEGSKRTKESDMSTPDKKGMTCHQCKILRCKSYLVFCSKCIKKRYCRYCIGIWYPGRWREEVRAACPFCMGNCNCTDCLRKPLVLKFRQLPNEKDGNVKLKQLQYLLVKVLPVLRDIYTEQKRELEIETAITGVPVTESNVIRFELDPSERIFCDLCRTFITNFHRGCQNPDCSCHVCLSCSKELREGHDPGKIDWKLNSDSTIPCPPTELCGCGTSTLELRRLRECDWIENLITSAEEITLQFRTPDVDIAHGCSSCTAASSDSIRRQAASRKSGHDNFLYSPNAVDLSENDIAHFQSHWVRAEPVIVRNVLEKTSGLSWEPKVIWRACKEIDPKHKCSTLRALDCLDWCEIEITIHQFCKGYVVGRKHLNDWPELLKLKDWPPQSTLFEECLPRHNAEFISALPFFDYTDPEFGILNLTARLPERFMKRNLGPTTDIAYGFPEELNRGDSVTKLHSDITDSVNVLTHTAKVNIYHRQYRRIKEEQRNYAEAQLRKQYCGQRTEASGRENGEALEKCDGSTVENGLVMPTLPSTPPWDEEDAPEETKDNANESTKAVHGGAVWDIFRREDVPKLTEYLKRHKHEFRHMYDEPVKYVDHPIHDQIMFLSESQKKQLKEEYDIEPWTFEQHLGEAVFIPAGCPYQVRNRQSCVKVALGFVSPESVEECIRLTQEYRRLPKDHRFSKDKLEIKKIVLHAASSAIREAQSLMQNSRNKKTLRGLF